MRGRIDQHHAIRLRRARASPVDSGAVRDDGPGIHEKNSQRPRPSAAALRHRRAQPAGPASPPLRALAGPSVLLHRMPAYRAFFRFVGWLSHTIQPTTGSASFSTRGKRHADTRTRTRPDLDHKHHKSSYKPELKIE